MTWESRYFVRDFTTDLPPREVVDTITNCVNYIPSQVADNDHFWVLLEPEHKHIKQWLVDNVHYHNIEENGEIEEEHFAHLIDAPYVLHCAYNTVTKTEKEFDFQLRNSFFSAGAIIGEIVHSGLDSTVIGCTEGFQENKNAKRLEYCKLLGDTFPELKELELDPSLTVGFGYGKKHTGRIVLEDHGHKWYSLKNSSKSPNLIKVK